MVLTISASSAGCRPPQVLGDPECFKTVDALWTAVTARSPKLVEQVQGDLQRLHTEGKLSEPGLAALAVICERAAGGEWEPAARELKSFIRGQRRSESKRG